MTRRPRARRTRRKPPPSAFSGSRTLALDVRSIALARSGRSTGRDGGASSYRESRRVARSTERLSTSRSRRNLGNPEARALTAPLQPRASRDDSARCLPHHAPSKTVFTKKNERFPHSLRQAASPPLRVVRPRAAPLPAASRRVTPTRATRARPAAAETARTPPRLPASLTRLAAAARRDAARGMTIRPLRTGPNTRGGARAALALAATLNPPTGRITPTAPATLAAAKGRTSSASPRRIWIRSRTPYRARAPGRMRSRAS